MLSDRSHLGGRSVRVASPVKSARSQCGRGDANERLARSRPMLDPDPGWSSPPPFSRALGYAESVITAPRLREVTLGPLPGSH